MYKVYIITNNGASFSFENKEKIKISKNKNTKLYDLKFLNSNDEFVHISNVCFFLQFIPIEKYKKSFILQHKKSNKPLIIDHCPIEVALIKEESKKNEKKEFIDHQYFDFSTKEHSSTFFIVRDYFSLICSENMDLEYSLISAINKSSDDLLILNNENIFDISNLALEPNTKYNTKTNGLKSTHNFYLENKNRRIVALDILFFQRRNKKNEFKETDLVLNLEIGGFIHQIKNIQRTKTYIKLNHNFGGFDIDLDTHIINYYFTNISVAFISYKNGLNLGFKTSNKGNKNGKLIKL